MRIQKSIFFILAVMLFCRIVFSQADDLATAKMNLSKAQSYQWMADIQQKQAAYYLGQNPNLQAQINKIIVKINLELRKSPKNAPFLMARSYAYYAIVDYVDNKTPFGKNKLTDAKIKTNLALASKDIEKALSFDKSLAEYFSIRGKIRVFQCKAKVFSSDKDCYETPLTDFTNAIYSSPDSYYFYDDRIELNKMFGKTDLIKADEDFKAVYEPLTTRKLEAGEKLEANQTAENFYEAAKINFDLFLTITSVHDETDDINDEDVLRNYLFNRESYLIVSRDNINESLKLKQKADYFAFRGKTNLYYGSIYDDEKGRETAVKYYESAIKDYTEAIKLNPNNTDFYVERGVTYGYLGKEDLKNADTETAKKIKSKQ
jgi:tetratricopeptide (TPR) repeat protein